MKLCMHLAIILCVSILLLSGLSAQTCQDDILRFSTTGSITSSSTKISTGEHVNISCTSKCAWSWHMFYINNAQVIGGYNDHSQSTTSITNTIMNCPGCSSPAQLDCTNSIQGPVQTSLNTTFLSSGDYYVQCVAHLFILNSQFWPNEIFKVYSENIKIQVIEPVSSSSSSQYSSTMMSSLYSNGLLSSMVPSTSINTLTLSSSPVTTAVSSSLITASAISSPVTTSAVSSPVTTTKLITTTETVTNILTVTTPQQSCTNEPTVSRGVTSEQDTSFDLTSIYSPLAVIIFCFAISFCLVCIFVLILTSIITAICKKRWRNKSVRRNSLSLKPPCLPQHNSNRLRGAIDNTYVEITTV